MQHPVPLSSLRTGEHGYISSLHNRNPEMLARLNELGFYEKSEITCLFSSMLGDPRAYRVKDAVIALRNDDAAQILCIGSGGAK